MPLQPSASKTTQLLNCSWAFGPDVDIPHEESVSEAPRYGSAFHELMEVAPLKNGERFDGPLLAALVDEAAAKWALTKTVAEELAGHVKGSLPVLQKWLAGKNPWEQKFEVAQLRRETSYGIALAKTGVGSVREIRSPRSDDHFYEDLLPREVAATADLDAPNFVMDYKTGSRDDHFSTPSRNDQLKTLSLASATGDKDGVVSIFHADRRGLPIIYAEQLSDSDRTKHAKQLYRAVKRIGDGSMRPGEAWCHYCAARTICPTQTANLLTGAAAVVTDAAVALAKLPKGGLVKKEDVGRLHLFFSELDRLKRVAQPAMKAFAKALLEEGNDFVVRPDGKVLIVKKTSRESLSKGKIVEALGAPEAERLFNKLRKAGALETTESEGLYAEFPD
jgi:hypothetical protein